ncbi:hypothetical protein T06_8265, partial [Trichinella sp. T6]
LPWHSVYKFGNGLFLRYRCIIHLAHDLLYGPVCVGERVIDSVEICCAVTCSYLLFCKSVLLNLYEGQSLNACSCSAEFCKLRQELYRKPFLIVIIEPFPTFFWCHGREPRKT